MNKSRKEKKHKIQKDVLRVMIHGDPNTAHGAILQIWDSLQEKPSDLEYYELLLEAAKMTPSLRGEIEHRLKALADKGVDAAKDTLAKIDKLTQGEQVEDPVKNSTQDELLALADSAYYAEEYGKAIRLYRQVLNQDPSNPRALDQLNKAMRMLPIIRKRKDLPREAIQYFRRARSYIAARDVETAVKMLEAAIETANIAGKDYVEAEELLSHQTNWLVKVDFVRKADSALEEGEWQKALGYLENAQSLDRNDEDVKTKTETVRGLLEAEGTLKIVSIDPGDIRIRKEKFQEVNAHLDKIQQAINVTYRYPQIIQSDKFNELVMRSNLLKDMILILGKRSFFLPYNVRDALFIAEKLELSRDSIERIRMLAFTPQTLTHIAWLLGLAGLLGGASIFYNWWLGVLVAFILFLFSVITIAYNYIESISWRREN
jgi:tetratricopeptide (TPR) repeat protein